MNLNSSDPKLTLNSWLQESTIRLARAGISSPRLDCLILLEHVISQDRSWVLAHPGEVLAGRQLSVLEGLITERIKRKPLSQLTHLREFYGLNLYINSSVLTPRIETEQMVEWAIKYAAPNSRLIDVGTGSGAIALAIKQHRPDLEVFGTDISEKALAVAQKNAAKLNLDVNFMKNDLLNGMDNPFTTVCANLPYLIDSSKNELMPEVLYEPDLALFSGADGLDLYRKLLNQLSDCLEPKGYFFAECDSRQQGTLTTEAVKNGLKPIKHSPFILGFQKN